MDCSSCDAEVQMIQEINEYECITYICPKCGKTVEKKNEQSIRTSGGE